MRFKTQNIEQTLRQYQHNEFLIRISKDPLKPNLRRSAAVGELFVLESMMLADVVWVRQQTSSPLLLWWLRISIYLSQTLGIWPFSAAAECKKFLSGGTDFWSRRSANHVITFRDLRLLLKGGCWDFLWGFWGLWICYWFPFISLLSFLGWIS